MSCLWSVHSPDYLNVTVLVSLLFAPTVNHHLRQSEYLTIFSDCFWMSPEKRLFSLGEFQVRSSKNRLASNDHKTKQWEFSENGSLEGLQSHCVLHAVRLLVLTMIMCYFLLKLPLSLVGRYGARES